MGSVRSWNVWVLAWVLLVACSQSGDVAFEEGDASVDASTSEDGSTLAPSEEARAVVARLDARLEAMAKAKPPSSPGEPAVLEEPPPPASVRLSRAGELLQVHAEASPRAHHADLRLPTDARGAFRIADKQSGLEAAVALRGASEAEAEIVDGQVVYRKAAAFGTADLVHRPSAEGTEDFILFDESPGEESLVYEMALSANVAGLRLVENTLELIDEGGAPRLRVAPPYVIGADGQRHDATLSVKGCAFDTNPAAPWGRKPIAPGASECEVEVAWGERGVSYPAIVDPTWTTTGAMKSARYRHTATLLDTGKVLVAGGMSGTDYPTYRNSADLYDPETGTWASTGSMTGARRSHTATKLEDGRVLVTGGYYTVSDVFYGTTYYYLNSANLYQPSTGTWSATGNLKAGRYLHAATRLADGSVLVVGGETDYSTTLSTAERYDVTKGTFAFVGSLITARRETEVVTLANGKALVVAGRGASGNLASAELYDPATQSFAAAAVIPTVRYGHGMTLLGDGRVLMVGGYDGSAYLGTGAIYNPATSGWSAISTTATPRVGGTLTLLTDGKVLFAGGVNGSYVSSAELYDVNTNRWSGAAEMALGRRYHTATRLPSGGVLLAGGYNGSATSSAEIFAISKIACTNASDCASGFCVDGYCCDSACDGACNQCDQVGAEGHCRVKAAGSPGRWSCAPYTCNGTSADCPSSCTADSQCVSGSFCDGGICISVLGQGSVCERNAQCASGACSDGFCCDRSCDGACDVCARSLGASADGTCTNLPNTTACGPFLCTGSSGACPSTCASDAACIDSAYCDASRSCTPKLANGGECIAGKDCQSGLCVDGHCCNSACTGSCERCDIYGALGTCVTAASGNPGSPSCSPYLCNGASVSCPTSCTSDAQCASDAYCKSGSCVTKAANGAACTAAKECRSGVCTGGVCCDKACGGACETCLAAEGATANGACTILPAGMANCANGLVCTGTSGACPASCQTDSQCAPGRFCNSSKQCAVKLAQGSACTAAGQCTTGHCVDGVCCNSGCAGGCDSCNLAGSAGTCVIVARGSSGANPSCGAFLCDGVNASCPSFCASDIDCSQGTFCLGGQCQAKRGLGALCSGNAFCASGFCADGVCCNSACSGGSCDRCDLPGSVGTCKNAPLGSEGTPTCGAYVCNGASAACPSTCSGDANCASGHACVGGSCKPKAANGEACVGATECASGHCADGVCCEASCTGACARCDLPGKKGKCGPAPKASEGKGCGFYLCDGTNLTCAYQCEKDDDCRDAYCSDGVCIEKAENGEICEEGSRCKSGFCADGVCCESACGGQCARCDEPGSIGLCRAVTGAPVGGRPSCHGDSSVCGGSCDGVNEESCRFPDDSIECGDPSCDDGIRKYARLCDGKGSCGFETEVCAPYACDGNLCRYSCETDSDCTQSAECIGGECKGTLEPGASCLSGGECQSGFCADGVCCESSCSGDCMACNVEGSKGSCVRDPNDASCSQSDTGEEAPWEIEDSDSGCGCRVAGEKRGGERGALLGGFGLVLAWAARRRRGVRHGESDCGRS